MKGARSAVRSNTAGLIFPVKGCLNGVANRDTRPYRIVTVHSKRNRAGRQHLSSAASTASAPTASAIHTIYNKINNRPRSENNDQADDGGKKDSFGQSDSLGDAARGHPDIAAVDDDGYGQNSHEAQSDVYDI